MTVYFSNKGNIDLDVIRTMGVSVKETGNPIGYFGTGLKYAIATLLRTGHIVSLRTNGETIQFRTRPKEIRGQTFNMVYMDEEQLGFTTDLGKNWTLWQAYRELYSNCIDEGGTIGQTMVEDDTVFTVQKGRVFDMNEQSIDDIHAERNQIFLQGQPWLVGDGIDVHRGKSKYVYYRGVRVHKLLKPSRFTYNFTCQMMLTEDRTLASSYDMMYKLGTRLPRIADTDFSLKVLDPDWTGLEGDIDFSDCHDPSEEFLDGLEKYRANAKLKERNRDMLRTHRAVKEHEIFTLSEEQAATVREACAMLRKLNAIVHTEDFTFVEHLGPDVYAMVRDGKIFITRQTIANGVDFLAITMYEEWIHDHLGYPDESRGMQQFLFDKILELIKQ